MSAGPRACNFLLIMPARGNIGAKAGGVRRAEMSTASAVNRNNDRRRQYGRRKYGK